MNSLKVVVLVVCMNATMLFAQAIPGPALQRTMTLPGVKGKFDHFALDQGGNRLFAAAAGNQTVEVVDLSSGSILYSLKGFGKPHGLAWIADTGELFVSDGAKAELAIYAGSPLVRVKTIALSDDADDMVYDDATGLLYVGHGGSNAANPARVAVVDVHSHLLVANLPVATHPEALELDAKSDRIFVNLADVGQVAVIEGKTHAIAATWTLNAAKGNTPLAYDEADDLLLVGCRTPAKIVALDGKTGKEISFLPTSAGADDLFFEPSTHRGYLITGSGAVDTVKLSPVGKLTAIAVTHTVAGAKTGFLDSRRGLLYIGIPGTLETASIRVYQTAK